MPNLAKQDISHVYVPHGIAQVARKKRTPYIKQEGVPKKEIIVKNKPEWNSPNIMEKQVVLNKDNLEFRTKSLSQDRYMYTSWDPVSFVRDDCLPITHPATNMRNVKKLEIEKRVKGESSDISLLQLTEKDKKEVLKQRDKEATQEYLKAAVTAHNLKAGDSITIKTFVERTESALREGLQGYIGEPINSTTTASIGNYVTSNLEYIATGACTGETHYHIDHIDSTGGAAIYKTSGTYSIDIESTGVGATVHVDFAHPEDMWLRGCNVSWNGGTVLQSAKEIVKQAIKRNLLIKMGKSRQVLPKKITPEELKAQDTLRDMITEKEWRRYITNGFLMVRGKPGFYFPDCKIEKMRGLVGPFWYQIFRDQRHTKVFKDNKIVGEICIHTDKKCPETDHVINLKLLVEFDEKQLWVGGNLRNTYAKNEGVIYPNNSKNLVTLFNESKQDNNKLYISGVA